MHAFAHYLDAKRTVDDRALNRRVLDRLRRELETVARPAIADIGAGVGNGIDRLLKWGLADDASYTAVEPEPDLLRIAQARHDRDASYVCATLTDMAADADHHARFDVVIAHALLDVVPLHASIVALLALTRPGGLLYLPITYDGETVFEPTHPDDEPVLRSYHRSMDAGGDSRTGRKLFHVLERAPAELLEVGSSDWIVHPKNGRYPHDEKFFLESILEMFEQSVGDTAAAWLATRRRQLQEGELVYLAHQLDYLARKPL